MCSTEKAIDQVPYPWIGKAMSMPPTATKAATNNQLSVRVGRLRRSWSSRAMKMPVNNQPSMATCECACSQALKCSQGSSTT